MIPQPDDATEVLQIDVADVAAVTSARTGVLITDTGERMAVVLTTRPADRPTAPERTHTLLVPNRGAAELILALLGTVLAEPEMRSVGRVVSQALRRRKAHLS